MAEACRTSRHHRAQVCPLSQIGHGRPPAGSCGVHVRGVHASPTRRAEQVRARALTSPSHHGAPQRGLSQQHRQLQRIVPAVRLRHGELRAAQAPQRPWTAPQPPAPMTICRTSASATPALTSPQNYQIHRHDAHLHAGRGAGCHRALATSLGQVVTCPQLADGGPCRRVRGGPRPAGHHAVHASCSIHRTSKTCSQSMKCAQRPGVRRAKMPRRQLCDSVRCSPKPLMHNETIALCSRSRNKTAAIFQGL